jgi:hypothetical protein
MPGNGSDRTDQKPIDWDDNSLRRHLEGCGFWKTEIELVSLLNRLGKRTSGQGWQGLELNISKRRAAAAMGCSPNAVVKAAQRLVERGLLAIVSDPQAGPSPTYVFNLTRLAKVEPTTSVIDPFASDGDALVTSGHQVVTGGHQPRASREEEIYKTRCNRDRGASASSQRAKLLSGDHLVTSGDQQVTTRLRDVKDDEVRRLDLDRLLPGYWDAVSQGWLDSSQDDMRKFLAVCHHAATSPTLRSPAAVVYSAVSAYRFDRVKDRSWDWAGMVVREVMHVKADA